METWSECCAAS